MSSAPPSTDPALSPELRIGGHSVARLADRVGATPFFAYDRARITERVAELRRALGPEIELGYAMKANPMPAVVQHLAGLTDWLDVASAGEMAVALDTGVGPDRVTFAGPGKTEAELRRAVAAGVLVELESAGEAHRLAAAGEALGLRPRVALRVNPDFAVKGSGMRMGGGPQQFGVDVEQAPALLAELARTDLDVLGFHIFAGSQNLHASILIEAHRHTAALLVDLVQHAPQEVRYLNLGGGFGIPYFAKDKPLELGQVADNLRGLVADVLAPAAPGAGVSIELGRYLVGEAGYYVTRVVDRKVSRGRTYLVVDGGLHHQLAASGNFGQVVRRNYPILVATRPGQPPVEPVSVVGCLCTPLDVLGDAVELPEADVGDLVVLTMAGAYGLTASPTAFLGHPAPAEILV